MQNKAKQLGVGAAASNDWPWFKRNPNSPYKVQICHDIVTLPSKSIPDFADLRIVLKISDKGFAVGQKPKQFLKRIKFIK